MFCGRIWTRRRISCETSGRLRRDESEGGGCVCKKGRRRGKRAMGRGFDLLREERGRLGGQSRFVRFVEAWWAGV